MTAKVFSGTELLNEGLVNLCYYHVSSGFYNLHFFKVGKLSKNASFKKTKVQKTNKFKT